MTTVRVRARGAASKYEIWARVRDLRRWPEWGPRLLVGHGEERLRRGLEGTLVGPLGVRPSFDVLEVDDERMWWVWTVRLGPARVRVEHEVDEGYAAAAISGPAPVVAGYAIIDRFALRRLVGG